MSSIPDRGEWIILIFLVFLTLKIDAQDDGHLVYSATNGVSLHEALIPSTYGSLCLPCYLIGIQRGAKHYNYKFIVFMLSIGHIMKYYYYYNHIKSLLQSYNKIKSLSPYILHGFKIRNIKYFIHATLA